MTTTLCIVDDHPIFRAGLRAVLAGEPSMKVVGEAGDADGARRVVGETRPDIVVLDIEIPGGDGLTLAREWERAKRGLSVIVMTMFKQESMVNAALDAGVKGYVVKDKAVTELLEAVRSVARGETYLSPAISGYLMKRRNRREQLEQERPALEMLTGTERRVLRFTAAGMSCKEIAAEMSISHRTVETHRNNIARKLDLRGDHRLLQFAIEHRSEL
ncbi:MAG: response regulator [Limisphaerales bacterium]